MNINKSMIEELIGTKPTKLDLYQKAFTHKSALKEYEELTGSFETLEFIGDSVLGFVITKYLYDRYEEKQEGFLTKARTQLVRGETLGGIANKLGLHEHVLMDEKGMRNGWNTNPKILEDVFEALIGAIYMDLGLLHAKQFVLSIYENPQLVDMKSIMVDNNYKDHLMRYTQSNSLPLPEYRVTSQIDGVFTVTSSLIMCFWGEGVQRVKNVPSRMPQRLFSILPSLKGRFTTILICTQTSKRSSRGNTRRRRVRNGSRSVAIC